METFSPCISGGGTLLSADLRSPKQTSAAAELVSFIVNIPKGATITVVSGDQWCKHVTPADGASITVVENSTIQIHVTPPLNGAVAPLLPVD